MISGLVLQLSQWTALSPPEKPRDLGRCPLPLEYRPECSTASSKGEQRPGFLNLAANVWVLELQRQGPAVVHAVGARACKQRSSAAQADLVRIWIQLQGQMIM